ncbi:MAG: CcmD family protein [Acidobacteriota bacterium]|jgi:CcmD family protein
MTSRLSRTLALAALLLVLPLVMPDLPAVHAQPSGSQLNTMAEGDALAAVEERRLRFLFWAYAVIWILMAAYLVSLGIRIRSVRQELDRMRERLSGPRS